MIQFSPKKIFLIVSIYASWMHCAYNPEATLNNKGVVIVPVADMGAESLAFLAQDKPVETVYSSLPYSPSSGPNSCARGHQLLFNELVDIKQEVGDEVECKVDNVFYEDAQRNRISTFWTLKKHIAQIKNNTDPINDALPQPYTLDGKHVLDNSTILSLIMPWDDPVTKTTYSIATRFVHSKELDTEHEYGVKLLNKENGNLEVVTSRIPKEFAVIGYKPTFKERQQVFVSLLKLWVATFNVVPYVWGGRSCTRAYSDNFSLVSTKRGNDDISYWVRTNEPAPYSGFDCSGLPLRAAQIAGLPYFFENTTTLANNIAALQNNEELAEGDLIFYPGHVMVVSDIEKNEIIEAVGYASGYAKLHTLKLPQVFEGINTFADLTAAYFEKQPLKRLKSDGAIFKDLPTFKLLKLQSLDK